MNNSIEQNKFPDKYKDSFICKGLDQLKEAAELILNKHKDNRIFAFYGEMGAGKTTLIQKLCESLEVEDIVSSPTFAIINEYETARAGNIYHFDFYRLKKLEEAFDIGYEDYFYSGDYCFIEWPEKVTDLLPENTILVYIRVDDENEFRTIYF